MKKTIITILISIALGLTAGWFFFRPSQEGGGTTTERKILYYVDPMHPAYKSDKPGTAPDCVMDLVPVYADEKGGSTDGGGIPGAVKISPEKQQLIGVQTSIVEYHEVEKTIRAVGQIAYAEPRQAYVTTKFEGYIEELFVDYTGKLVGKGQPLSPCIARSWSRHRKNISWLLMPKSLWRKVRSEKWRRGQAHCWNRPSGGFVCGISRKSKLRNWSAAARSPRH
jgi:hypothetical protein